MLEERIHHFHNITVKFSISSCIKGKIIISFTLHEKNYNIEQYSYKFKGNIIYARKIIENTIKHFENIPIDCGDIDLCFNKAFSLRKINVFSLSRKPKIFHF